MNRIHPPISDPNRCADCKLCCKLLPIVDPDLRKLEDNKWCSHCVPTLKHGCTIYDSRPETCVRYACLYLDIPSLEENLRPNRCHVIFSLAGIDSQGREVIQGVVDPAFPNAANADNVLRVIHKLASKCVVITSIGATNQDKTAYRVDGEKLIRRKIRVGPSIDGVQHMELTV